MKYRKESHINPVLFNNFKYYIAKLNNKNILEFCLFNKSIFNINWTKILEKLCNKVFQQSNKAEIANYIQ